MSAVYDYHLLNSSLLIAIVLFVLGAAGFLSRRNLIVMFLSAGVMLQGVTLALCAFSTFHGNWMGRAGALLLLSVTVAAGTVVLATVVVFTQRKQSIDVSLWRKLGRHQQPEDETGRPAVVPRSPDRGTSE